jgi:hypothetical protein
MTASIASASRLRIASYVRRWMSAMSGPRSGRGRRVVDRDGDALEDLVLVGAQQLVARGARHRVVEGVVEVQQPAVAQTALGLDAHDRVLQIRQGRGVRALGRQPGEPHLDGPAGVDQLAQGQTGARAGELHQAGRDLVVQHRHAAVDAAAGADDAVARQHADRLADRRLAHPQLGGHLLERGQPVADAEDARANRERDLLGDALVHALAGHRTERPARPDIRVSGLAPGVRPYAHTSSRPPAWLSPLGR